MVEIANGYLAGLLVPTKDQVATLIKMELCRMNYEHPDFLGNPRNGGVPRRYSQSGRQQWWTSSTTTH